MLSHGLVHGGERLAITFIFCFKNNYYATSFLFFYLVLKNEIKIQIFAIERLEKFSFSSECRLLF